MRITHVQDTTSNIPVLATVWKTILLHLACKSSATLQNCPNENLDIPLILQCVDRVWVGEWDRKQVQKMMHESSKLHRRYTWKYFFSSFQYHLVRLESWKCKCFIVCRSVFRNWHGVNYFKSRVLRVKLCWSKVIKVYYFTFCTCLLLLLLLLW